MSPETKKPFITLLASHWLSLLGVALTTTAGFSWLFVLPQSLGGHVSDPYIGILIFMVIPAILFTGLALIPIGIFLARRQVAAGLRSLPDRKTSWRRLGLFLGLMTFVNLLIGSQGTYRAVQHMETEQFCGQSCHVMNPEATAWRHAPHSHIECVECHIVPGAEGWFKAKMNGSAQMLAVMLNTFPRPIESAMESDKLVSSAATCENCHNRNREIGTPLNLVPSYKDDEANTRTETVLTMRVGGANGGIHGAHMGPGVSIRYAAADKKRQTIPWVEYKDAKGNVQTFTAADAKPGSIDALPKFEMQCVDCHNRPAHSFQTADRAVNNALESGDISPALPFVKKTGIALITATYPSQDEAAKEIPEKLFQFYQAKYPDIFAKQRPDIDAAAKALAAIYNRNVFPDLKVTWGTYPNNLGHTDAPGCFRCHDDNHATAAKKTITNDCSACHQMVAVDEASPEVLKTLGITAQKQ